MQKRLASILVEKLSPLQARRQELLGDKQRILDILSEGAGRARIVAQQTLHDARSAMKI